MGHKDANIARVSALSEDCYGATAVMTREKQHSDGGLNNATIRTRSGRD
jgi:hypothetical protein